jgi:hypothetical protein
MIKTFNLYAFKGVDFSKTLNIEFDISIGATISIQIRKNYDSSYFTNLDVSIINYTGLIQIDLSGEKSSLLKTGRYFCDITISEDTNTIISGEFLLSTNIIRSALTVGDPLDSSIPIGSDGIDVSYDIIEGLITAYAIGGNRIVVLNNNGKVEYADNENSLHINKIIGVTKIAVGPNQPIKVQNVGVFEDSLWNWTIGDVIYASTNGLMTQIVPSLGFIQEIGIAISTNKVLIDIKNSIAREE